MVVQGLRSVLTFEAYRLWQAKAFCVFLVLQEMELLNPFLMLDRHFLIFDRLHLSGPRSKYCGISSLLLVILLLLEILLRDLVLKRLHSVFDQVLLQLLLLLNLHFNVGPSRLFSLAGVSLLLFLLGLVRHHDTIHVPLVDVRLPNVGSLLPVEVPLFVDAEGVVVRIRILQLHLLLIAWTRTFGRW